jgi:hypothetical protein
MTEHANNETWTIRECRRSILRWGQVYNGVPHRCPSCRIPLLTGETAGFCCGPHGRRLQDVPPLPPLPNEFQIFADDPALSSLSRILNLIFSFASLETTHLFPNLTGPPGFVAIQGKIYHRIRPNHYNSAIRWLLHDGFMDNTPHGRLADAIPPHWINAVRTALLRLNPFVRSFQALATQLSVCPSAQLILTDPGTRPEIAACIVLDNTTSLQLKPRQLVVATRADHIQHVPTVSRMWEPLAYPLLFPEGTLGWGVIDSTQTHGANDTYEDGVNAPTTQMWHYRARLLREPRFQLFGRLTNEYVVDMFSRDLECRLAYIRANQLRLRQQESLLADVPQSEASSNIYLPASFLGSARWASEQVADALAIAAELGNPTFFVTMTCNPQWPEITSRLGPGQDFTDVPLIVVRVYKRMLSVLEKTLKTMFPNAGHYMYILHSIEFQKRGLPHAHILIKFPKPCMEPHEIDQVVSAEMPSRPAYVTILST